MVAVVIAVAGCYCGFVGWCVGLFMFGRGFGFWWGALCFGFLCCCGLFLGAVGSAVGGLLFGFAVVVVFCGVAFMQVVLCTSVVNVWYFLVLWFGDLTVVCCGFGGGSRFAGYCSIGWWIRLGGMVSGVMFVLHCGLVGVIGLWICCYGFKFFGGEFG